jgi:hypothetical protein
MLNLTANELLDRSNADLQRWQSLKPMEKLTYMLLSGLEGIVNDYWSEIRLR